MGKLLRYIKKHALSFLLITLLLVVQAQTELSLPGLMSDIISSGIQNNGITTAVPVAIRENQLKKIELLLDDGEIKNIAENFTLVSPSEATDKQMEEYPLLKTQSLYIRNEELVDEETLNESLLFASSVINIIDQDIVPIDNDFQLPEGMDIYTALAVMPDENRLEIITNIKTELEEVTEQMLEGVAFNFVRSEYEEIGINISSIQSKYIINIGFKMIGITLVGVATAFLVGFLSSKVAALIGRQIREDVFAKILHLNSSEYTDFSTASLITRTTNDVQNIQRFIIMFFRIIIYAPIMASGAIVKVLQTNNEITWIIAVIILLIIILLGAAFALIIPKFTLIQKLIDKMNLVTRESLSGIMVIRAFSNQDYQEAKFNEVNEEVVKNHMSVGRTFSVMKPMLEFILNASILFIIYVSSKQIDLGNMQIGDMTAFIQYTMQIVMSFIMIAMVAVMIPRAKVAVNRIFEVLDKEIDIKDPINPLQIENTESMEIAFNNVSFRYPNAEADVLSNISFTAKPGTKTAFIGSTGSGKSTLINLIPRFFDVTSGSITLNGVDIRDVKIDDLRKDISFVPQSVNLFSGTIESNLKMGNKESSELEMINALKVAQIYDFVEEREEGLQSPVSQGGTNYSGGQKQRISIARALNKESNILIFDDSFSALDFKTDANIRKELEQYVKERQATLLLIGQRVSSIMDSDQIVVLDKGQISGIGTHNELMQSSVVYQEIANSQLTQEELDNAKNK